MDSKSFDHSCKVTSSQIRLPNLGNTCISNALLSSLHAALCEAAVSKNSMQISRTVGCAK